jgi:hypothetical protein
MRGAIEMGEAIAKNNPETVQRMKDIMIRHVGLSLQEMMLNESQTITELSKTSPPPRKAFRSFLERKPERK